jgi:Kef-type K+ transport system membrane component KefB
MIRAVVLLVVVVALMGSARSFLPDGDVTVSGAGVALAFGFLVLAAVQVGNLFAAMRLPRLTGYLLTGLVCGPEISGLLTNPMLDGLRMVNGVAVGLIALAAGSELNIVHLRPRIRSVLLVGAVALPLAVLSAAGVALALAGKLPFMEGLGLGQRIAVAVTLGVVFASLSPSVALAMLAETSSEGPVSETVLGVVVLADIVIIVVFAAVHAVAANAFGVLDGDSIGPVQQLLLEVFGSMGIGVVIAGALAVYIRRVRSHVALFVLAVCVVCAEIGPRLHLDVLIICLTAGLLLENVLGVRGEVVSREIAPASLPVFAVFFALAGARLHLHDLKLVWPMALAFAAVRAITLFGGARVGLAIAKAEPTVQRWAPFGMLPQAGVSVGLAVLIARHFPTWGPQARALILGVITLNELIGPVLLRMALVRAGEAGKRTGPAGAVEH